MRTPRVAAISRAQGVTIAPAEAWISPPGRTAETSSAVTTSFIARFGADGSMRGASPSKRAAPYSSGRALLSSARMPEGLAAFLDALSRAVHVASDLVWGSFTMALLLGTGLFLTV